MPPDQFHDYQPLRPNRGWDTGPKSDAENWNWQRRTELLEIASHFLLEKIRHGETWNCQDDIDKMATDSTNAAAALRSAVERISPRCF